MRNRIGESWLHAQNEASKDCRWTAIELSASEHLIVNAEDPIPFERKSIGGFQIMEHLASGGMGDVYLAHDADGAPVAVKCFRKSAWISGDSQDQQARFERERRLSASVSHPNIVRIVAHGSDQGVQFIAMEYIDGENLREWMKRLTSVSPQQAIKIIRPVADAVACLHDQGIVHRDLKPENILLDQAELVKVTDFGLAATIEDIGSLTVSGQILGSADYLAPEQRHHLPTDGRADQFSLAVISYELLTGHKPLGIFKPPSAYHHELTPAIDAVVLRGLQKDPDDRFDTINEFADALQLAIDHPQRQPLSQPHIRLIAISGALMIFVAVVTAAIWRMTIPPVDVTATAVDDGPFTMDVLSTQDPQLLQTLKQVRQAQQDWAAQQALSVTSQNSIGMTLALIPPGRYTMGISDADIDASSELPELANVSLLEMLPQHSVTLSRGYWLGCFEVTVGQFQEFVTASGYQTDAERNVGEKIVLFGTSRKHHETDWHYPGYVQTSDHPAVMISWNDAIEFCQWLTDVENQVYRLPSEAEWEYACRAGSEAAWCFGDDEQLISLYSFGPEELPRYQMPPPDVVGGNRKPNALGLFDMHGNASEWCADVFDPQGYAGGSVTDPLIRAISTTTNAGDTPSARVMRGAGSMSRFWYRRSAVRSYRRQDHKSSLTGFRVVREIRDAAK